MSTFPNWNVEQECIQYWTQLNPPESLSYKNKLKQYATMNKIGSKIAHKSKTKLIDDTHTSFEWLIFTNQVEGQYLAPPRPPEY